MQQSKTVPQGEYDAATVARDFADALVDHKASDIVLLDLQNVTTLADYFVLANGTSARQINALARAVDERADELGVTRFRREGVAEDGWVLLDFGQIIVHLFSPEQRDFYDLEQRWREAPIVLNIQ